MYSVIQLRDPIEYKYDAYQIKDNLVTLAHEVGHNLGLHHDRRTLYYNHKENEIKQEKSYGYAKDGLFYTIMSYGQNYINVIPTHTFSNPKIKYHNFKVGNKLYANSVAYLNHLIPKLPRIKKSTMTQIENNYRDTNVKEKTKHLMSIQRNFSSYNQGKIKEYDLVEEINRFNQSNLNIQYYPWLEKKNKQQSKIEIEFFNPDVKKFVVENTIFFEWERSSNRDEDIDILIYGGDGIGPYHILPNDEHLIVKKDQYDDHLFSINSHKNGKFKLNLVKDYDDDYQPQSLSVYLIIKEKNDLCSKEKVKDPRSGQVVGKIEICSTHHADQNQRNNRIQITLD